ncbi:MAG: FGGY family carbohydrate kinase [Bacteroidia bacterium]
MGYLLAIDEGTSSARAVIFDLQGKILSLGRKNFSLSYPSPGWVEQDPEEVWQAQHEAILEALNLASLSPNQIEAIGITNQRETTVVWDKLTGEPLYNAIVWQDRRTASRCQILMQEKGEIIQARTGLPVDPYFSATKIEWLQQQVALPPSAIFGTMDSWLLWKLLGIHATDVTNASRTLLWNLHTHQWDEELLTVFGLSQEKLPHVYPSAHLYGICRAYGAPWEIRGVIGDQQAALLGQGCLKEGMAKNTYGTGSFFLKNIGTRPLPAPMGLLTTIAWETPTGERFYAWEGAVFTAAAALQWLERIGLLTTYHELDNLSEKDSQPGLFFVPAFTGLGAPYWDPYARGLIIGIGADTSRENLLTAALEAIAYQTAEVINLAQPISALRVDGGVSVNPYLLRLQANLVGVPIEPSFHPEATAWGAALLAGWHKGILQPQIHPSTPTPIYPTENLSSSMKMWKNAVQRAQNWVTYPENL